MSKLDIAIWSDVVCPWCPIGHAGLQEALELLGDDVEATVKWKPFQLSPDVPPEGRTMRENFALKSGKPFAQFAPARENVVRAGREVGFVIPWDEDPEGKGMIWNTFTAHKLLRWALDSAGAEKQCILSDALFRANFQEQRNISDDDELLDIADTAGLDRAAAKEALADPALEEAVNVELQRGQQMGVTSVPTFVINGKYGIPGGQRPEQFAKILKQIAAESETA